jgi:predicted DNA-binding protein with PD1-like motif
MTNVYSGNAPDKPAMFFRKGLSRCGGGIYYRESLGGRASRWGTNEFSDSPDMPDAALLNSGDAPAYLLVFHTGQEVMKGLLAFAKKYDLVAGHLTGIGALSGAVIGYFDPGKNAYLRHHEDGQAELLSLTGNLALNDNEPFFHIHAALGLRDGSARGGHVFEANVRPTVELVLTTSPRPVRREIDHATGLPLLDP